MNSLSKTSQKVSSEFVVTFGNTSLMDFPSAEEEHHVAVEWRPCRRHKEDDDPKADSTLSPG